MEEDKRGVPKVKLLTRKWTRLLRVRLAVLKGVLKALPLAFLARPLKSKKSGITPKKLKFEGFDIRDCGAEGACGYKCIAVGAALMRGNSWEDMKSKCFSAGAPVRGKGAAPIQDLWEAGLVLLNILASMQAC